ncbi:TIGR01212 family radical SAM protein [Formosa algae]|uniref:Radical SAM protein (TIGR01212 family) n=1 Tax=Formosa algae TaxID=225843 RepID=A0A9X0YJG7_9FLAO|nr:TIGR01212 family radical SAM protein [Formosa algae]MBP1838229.1 radical SAM protein (TIGR01212 family) [Formosa algae]MDQ0334364.1 radical SAM protein (TIGR01212 family) [Formosa algae]OEI80691.1 TIGR01212 family radical SAM protein [Formosa algae]
MIYAWGHEKRYNDYSSYIKHTFKERVQKVSVDAGFSCPNRDGSKGYGGCTFCNNSTFNPSYCSEDNSISSQINTGIGFFAEKYKTQKYLAYFQAYSNTYDSLDSLKKRYEEALSLPKIIGLVIGTRPDCISDELLEYLATLSQQYYVTIEYGIESTNNTTLKEINRGHDYQTSIETIKKTHEAGIHVGAHLILGLPGETRKDILQHAQEMSKLPLDFLKLHQLQLVKGSIMGERYLKGLDEIDLYTAEAYIDLVIDFIELLHPKIVLERFVSQSPKEFLIAPKWNLKNFEFVDKVNKRLQERNTWQGKLHTV